MPFVQIENLPHALRAAADLTDMVPDHRLVAATRTTTTRTTTTTTTTTATTITTITPTRQGQVASLEKTSLPEGESSSDELSSSSSSSSIEVDQGSSSSSSSTSSHRKVNAWVALIQADAQALWTSPTSTEIWTFHGLDPQELSKHWSAYTLVRLLLPLIKGVQVEVDQQEREPESQQQQQQQQQRGPPSPPLLPLPLPEQRADQCYAQFVERFWTVRASMQHAMRTYYFQQGMVTIRPVLDATVGTVEHVVCDQLERLTRRRPDAEPSGVGVGVVPETERHSLIYFLLTQRPDLFLSPPPPPPPRR